MPGTTSHSLPVKWENPKHNLPLSLLLGTGTVILLYFLANVAYISVLGMDKIANAENRRVATSMMELFSGAKGKYFVTAAMIMISTFGCLNGIIFTAARVYYAMAKDGMFLKSAAKLNKNNVANSITMQCIWSVLLCFTGTYGKLLGSTSCLQ
ncbi:MAG: APC family permease [Bacteroidia bacterium]